MMGERRLVLETPVMHSSRAMQSFITKEVARPCKQWIHEVLENRREADRVKLRTPDFVLLPDVDFPRRKRAFWQEDENSAFKRKGFHWLAVLTDTNLRTIRDLRQEHIYLLTKLYSQCCAKIKEETNISPDQVMAYLHYPPSVYQMHVHFRYPIGPSLAHDAFRIHLLANVINNLHIDGDYYRKSLLQLPVYPNTELHTALRPARITVTRDRFILLLKNSEPIPKSCSSTSHGSRPSTPDPPTDTSTTSPTPDTST